MARNDLFATSFEVRMLPAMLHAFVIARNEAMLSGAKAVRGEFQARIDELCQQVGIPDLHHHVDGARFHAACSAIAHAGEFFWFTHTTYWTDKGEVLLVVDGRPHELGYGLTSDCPVLDGLRDLVASQCGVASVRLADVSDHRRFDPAVHVVMARAASEGVPPSPLTAMTVSPGLSGSRGRGAPRRRRR